MNFEALFNNLDPEDLLVLTPNRRLSAFFLEQLGQWQVSLAKTAWPCVKALPFTDWLKQLHTTNFQSSDLLLNESQVEYLWHEILTEHIGVGELLQQDAAVKHAVEAMRMLVLWQVPLDKKNFDQETDWKLFYDCFKRYQQYCQKMHYTDNYHLAESLINAITQNCFSSTAILPKKICLLGFDEISPLWNQLLEALKIHCEIEKIEFSCQNQTKSRFEFSTFNEELKAVITWAQQQYATNKNQNIACIIPSIATKRAQIEKEFIKAFSPKIFLNLEDKDEMPFNISAGQSLAQFEIIKTALKLISFDNSQISIQEIQFLLRNQFIMGYYKEYLQRSALEAQILNWHTYTISVDQFLKLAEKHTPILAKVLQQVWSLEYPTENSMLAWLNFFNSKLNAFGWPGERELSSQNYQVVLRFKQLFSEQLKFDLVVKTCNYKKVTNLLIKAAQDTIFQVKTPKQNIQLLGSLEAAGMVFDKLWIMEVNDKQWPAAANPNPFIPHKLQSKYKLPHANSARELLFSQVLFQRYMNSATEIIFSYAREDETYTYNCSNLIENIPLQSAAIFSEDLIDTIQTSGVIESYQDLQAPKISNEELSNIRGGTSILAIQATCPFRAFATYRLGATAAAMPQPGLTALERGAILHAALDICWQQIKSQQELSKLTDLEIIEIIKVASRAAIFSVHADLYQLSPKLFQLEFHRIINLVNQWLTLEKQRNNFTVVATEQALSTEFAGLPLKIRIDRVDQLENGALILIDYKTSIVSINRWFGERLDEPQLPLYALLYPAEIQGIVFGQIKRNEFSIKGIGSLDATDIGIKNIAELEIANRNTWDQQKQQWQTDLEKLATDFLNGDARVDPKDGNQSCAYCELESLCRIGEQHDITV